jgi:hypothetical protein
VTIKLTRYSGESRYPEDFLGTGFRRYDVLSQNTYLRGAVLNTGSGLSILFVLIQ